jgi:hypothetical protein
VVGRAERGNLTYCPACGYDKAPKVVAFGNRTYARKFLAVHAATPLNLRGIRVIDLAQGCYQVQEFADLLNLRKTTLPGGFFVSGK